MSRILSRPMFRRGGSADGGITSGLNTPKRGRVNEPGSYSYTLPDILPTKKDFRLFEDIFPQRSTSH